MTFNKSMVIYRRSLLLTKKETKTYKSKYASKCDSLSKRNSQDKKDEQQLKQIHQNDIVEVTKYNIDIPDERLFLRKIFMVLHQEKKVYAGKIRLYARVHFSKRVTAVNKKGRGKRPN